MYIAVLSWVIYTLLIKSLSKKYDGLTLTFAATFSGVITLFFLTFAENNIHQIVHISETSVLALMYMGIFSAGITYLLYNYNIEKIGPTKTSSIVYSCVPIFVTILSILFFDEKLTIALLLSLTFIIIGFNLLLHKSNKKN